MKLGVSNLNYLREINAFYDRLETNPLSGGAVSLWHALMQVNNRARWKKKFTVAVVVLCYKSGLSESSFKRARKELYEKGYIHYEKQLGNKAAMYEMISLDFNSEEEGHYQPSKEVEEAPTLSQGTDKSSHSLKLHPDNEVNHNMDHKLNGKQSRNASALIKQNHTYTTEDDSLLSKETDSLKLNPNYNVNRNLDGNLNHNADALIKQNNTKQNNTYTAAENRKLEAVYELYEQNFGKLNSYMKNELTKQIRDLGEDLVLHAMKKTLDRGKTNWNYAKAILTDWKSKGFLSVDQIDLKEVKFKKSRISVRGNHQTICIHKLDLFLIGFISISGSNRKNKNQI